MHVFGDFKYSEFLNILINRVLDMCMQPQMNARLEPSPEIGAVLPVNGRFKMVPA